MPLCGAPASEQADDNLARCGGTIDADKCNRAKKISSLKSAQAPVPVFIPSAKINWKNSNFTLHPAIAFLRLQESLCSVYPQDDVSSQGR